MSQLALGTVQFGLDYGINNSRGRVPKSEVCAILRTARKAGIDTLDTASAYGDSENVLGECLEESEDNFRIVTKLAADLARGVAPAFEESLGRLRRKHVAALMFHSFATYGANPRLFDELVSLKTQGRVERIGFSLYKPEEAELLLARHLPFDIIQVPYNLFDRRFETVFGRLKSQGVEIHVRSVFLQGLFFKPLDALDDRFAPVRPMLEAIHEAADKSGLGIPAICLAFADRIPEIDRIVVGVDGLDNLESNIRAFNARSEGANYLGALDNLSVEDENIILPYNWTKR